MSSSRRNAKLPNAQHKTDHKSDKSINGSAKSDQSLTKTPNEKAKAHAKPKRSPRHQITKTQSNVSSTTPPKQSMRMSVSTSKIDITDDMPLSNLDELNNSTSTENNSGSALLNDLPELDSDELNHTHPVIEIPQEVRLEAGQNWRLKEAILNSFIFGKPSIKSQEFARSDSDIKTAEIVASAAHTMESKKFRVKLHLGMPNPL